MQKFFRKAFGLYAGEGRQALCFARMAMLWAFASTCLDTLSDGLFLERIGAQFLPRAYFLVACGMLGVSTLVLYSLKKTSPYRILTLAIGAGALLCLGSALLLSSSYEHPLFWYGLKIGARLFFTVMLACSWTFIDQYHDLQDAKRVYPLYGASYFFGTILAGGAIHWLLPSLGFPGLLVLSSLFLLGAFLETRNLFRKAAPLHDDTVEGSLSTPRDPLPRVLRLILRSPFTILLLLVSLCIQLLITVTECNYLEAFGRLLEAPSGQGSIGEGEIASFLGTCRAAIAGVNLFMGIFLYNRWVRKFGLRNVLLITPLFFLGVYTFWTMKDALLLAILGLFAVDGILFTVEDTSFNLLSGAVPAKLRSRVRIINDSFFEPIGMLLSALLLLGFETDGLWIGLSLALLVLLLSFGVRSFYPKAIFTSLKENALHFERSLSDWLSFSSRREQKQMRQDLFKALRSPEEEVRLLALEGILSLKDPSLLSEALLSARSLGTTGKIRFLKLIEQNELRQPTIFQELKEWLARSESPELSKWVSFALAQEGHLSQTVEEEDLRHPDLFLRGAALLTMKQSVREKEELIASQIEEMLRSPRIDEVKIALDILAEQGFEEQKERLASLEKALPFLSHPSLLVKRAAARCFVKGAGSGKGRLLPRLIEELENARDNAFRLTLLSAIGKICQEEAGAVEEKSLKELLLASVHFRPNERRKAEQALSNAQPETLAPLLLAAAKDIALPERARLLASKILSRLSLSDLQQHLIDILDIEIDRAYFYFYFGQTIQAQYPLYDLSMLQDALLTGYQSILDFIIHLLGIAGSLEDPDLLVRSLQSRSAKTRAHAVESLEKTCNTRIFRLIAPLVDDLPLEEKMAACLRWRGDYPKLSLEELLTQLDTSPSLFDKAASARLKSTLKTPLWKEQLLHQITEQKDPHFTQYAQELLSQ